MSRTTIRPRRRRRRGRPTGPRPDTDQRRDELLEAAARAIRKIGPDVSMDELAAEAGMSKPILYAHFGDKAGLATALAERHLADLMPVVLGSFTTGLEPKVMVRSAVDAFIGFVEADPEVYRFLVRGVGAAQRSFIEQPLVEEFGLRIAQVLRTGLRGSGGDTGPAEVWSFAILGAVLSGAEWWLSRPSMSRADVVDYLTALVWGGLAAGGVTGLSPETVFTPPTEGK